MDDREEINARKARLLERIETLEPVIDDLDRKTDVLRAALRHQRELLGELKAEVARLGSPTLN